MGGPSGFDYNIVHHYLDRKNISGEAFDSFIIDFKVVERAALAQIHKGK